jgi:hypothetical protein
MRESSLGRIDTYLVHIDPQSIDVRTIDAIKELNELLVPVLLRVRVEPIREVARSRPNDSLVVSAVILLHEDVIAQTLIERWIGLFVVHRRVNHDNVVLVSGMNRVNKILDKIGGKPFRVQGEDSSTVHVVDCLCLSFCRVIKYFTPRLDLLSVHMTSKGIFASE